MVKGLAMFADHFAMFSNQYIIIGATACSLALELRDLEFRITKDIDMVLIVETLTPQFSKAFWEFIKAGGYSNRRKSSGNPQFYRFDKPSNHEYPSMIELFSRIPDQLDKNYKGILVPIPISEEASSLSAILLDEDYYHFIQSGRYHLDSLSFLMPEYLIVLKAKAWIDLSRRKRDGEAIDASDIAKHKNDILRLYQILEPDKKLVLESKIKEDMREFLKILAEEPMDLKNLKIRGATPSDIIERLHLVFSI